MKAISTPLWRFGPFEADAAEHQLRRDGEIVPVTRKSFALLATLLSRPGKLFTKAELFDIVWAGSVVTDAALSRAIRELRIALGDDASEPRYIATAHGLGFRFVAALEGDAAAPAPALSPPVAAAPGFVARAGELTLLDEALAAACAGRRQVVFVTGEAGIGKTALVEAFLARHAHRADLWTTQGRCVEQYGTGDAFLPIVEALENLTRQVGPEPLRSVLARFAPSWLAQLPWLAEPMQGSTAAAPAATSAQGMLREIAHALEELAAQTPIVLWLEDLHWSDPSSLAVVSFIAGRREPGRLLLVASFRPDDALGAASPLHGLVLRLIQRGQAHEAALGLLDVAAVEGVLTSRFGAAAHFDTRFLADLIHKRTEGNALFVTAIVDDMVRRGTVARADDRWVLTASASQLDIALPESLRQLVHHRVEQLSIADRRLVEAAAVAGTSFAAAAVAAALNTGSAEVEDRCARLAEQGQLLQRRSPVAWPDGTVSAGFSFVHALYWHGIHERVTPSRRAEWQGRIGAREEQAFGVHGATIAAELSMRFEAAGDLERSVRYLRQAGASALTRHAYVECIDLLRHALALLPRLPAAQPDQELDLLLPLGAALMAAQGYASDDVEATYLRALALSRDGARPADLRRALRGLWNVVFLRADLERAKAAADELMLHATASGQPGMVFDAHVKLGQTCLHLGDVVEARRQFELALELPVSASDPMRLREAPRLYAYLAWALWYIGLPEQALTRANEAIASARDAGSPHSSAFALGYASMVRVMRGEMAEALQLALAQKALAVQHGLVYWSVLADFAEACASLELDIERRGRAMSDAIAAMHSIGARVGTPHLLALLADAELGAGRPDKALQALAESSRIVAANHNALDQAEVARLVGEATRIGQVEGGAYAASERHFRQALEIAKRQGSRALELRAATSLANSLASRGEPQDARDLLAPIADTFAEGLDTRDVVSALELLARLDKSIEKGKR